MFKLKPITLGDIEAASAARAKLAGTHRAVAEAHAVVAEAHTLLALAEVVQQSRAAEAVSS